MSIDAGKRTIEAFQHEFFEGFHARSFPDIGKLLSQLDGVQEQPQLLDAYLHDLIDPVLVVLTENLQPRTISPFCSDLYHVIYYYSKIRGSKIIVKFLPNDVHLFGPVVSCLEQQSHDDQSLWQARYILLLWISLICMAPFDMRRFDKAVDTTTGHLAIVDRIMTLANRSITESSKEREAAGLLLARLLTRKDIHDLYIPEFMHNSLGLWNSTEITLNHRTGLLTCLCEIYKIGNRDVLARHVDTTLAALHQIDGSKEMQGNTLLRKLRVKLAQRLALSLLRPTLAAWRYRNDNGSIVEAPDQLVKEPEVDDKAVAVVEDVVGLLVETLSDKDTIVRYSAAKGLGRITSRLNQDFALEVIDAIIELLQNDIQEINRTMRLLNSAREATWHGACLALAELCRAGALLPSRLERVIPLVVVAMKFDIKRGSYSVGTNVRDAGCYVMWSVLRAYKSDILLPFAKNIAKTLIVVAMFDREVSVRRAASAAYQEGVGRHPDEAFPDGIAVLSKADFFAVGQRRMSFLEVAPAVFVYEEYRLPILSYLASVSCQHWDEEIRELAGQSLKTILILQGGIFETSSTASTIFEDQIRLLASLLGSIDVSARHGSFYALGEIAAGLSEVSTVPEVVSSSWQQLLIEAGSNIEEYNFKGPNAALMCRSVCHHIKNVVILSGPACRDQDTRVPHEDRFFAIASNSLAYANEQVRSAAVEALYWLCVGSKKLDIVVARIGQTSKLPSTIRKGWLMLYGRLMFLVSPQASLQMLAEILSAAKLQNDATRDDPELRKISVEALSNIVPLLTESESFMADQAQAYLQVIQCLEDSLQDYTIDARGDVGSWVREAASRSTYQLMLHLTPELVDTYSARLTSLLALALAQCLGKIDNLRTTATRDTCMALQYISTDVVSEHPFRTLCCQILSVVQHAMQCLDEGQPSTSTFENLVELLHEGSLRERLILEYLVSGSSGSQSTMHSATESLQRFLDDQTALYLDQTLASIVVIMSSSKDDERVLVPVLNSTAGLFEAQIFIDITFNLDALFMTIQSSTLNARNMGKIMAAVRCYAALACTAQEVRYKAWKKLSLTLNHKFPRIRAFAAQSLYTVLSNLDLEAEEDTVPVVDALTSIDWSLDVDKSRVETVKSYKLP